MLDERAYKRDMDAAIAEVNEKYKGGLEESARKEREEERSGEKLNGLVELAGRPKGVSRSDALRLLHLTSRQLEVVVQRAVFRDFILVYQVKTASKSRIVYKRKPEGE